MPINFPTSPALNEIYSFGEKSWKFNGNAWITVTGNTNYISSDIVTEGITNLYYTDNRVRSAISASLTSDFIYSNVNVESNITIASNTSALRVSPTNVNSGVFLTISSGATLKLI